jgi:hypothetical protein
MSETNQIINPTIPSASEVRRQKREAARLAQAQRVTKVTGTRQTITVYEGDPGTYRDPDPANMKGWTMVVRKAKRARYSEAM